MVGCCNGLKIYYMFKTEPSPTDFVSGIAKSFHDIEKQDRKVTRINMPKEILFNIMTTRDSQAMIYNVTKAPQAIRSFRGQGEGCHTGFTGLGGCGRPGEENPLVRARSYAHYASAYSAEHNGANPYSQFWSTFSGDPNLPSMDPPIAAMWGAEVHIKDKLEVVSDPIGMVPGYRPIPPICIMSPSTLLPDTPTEIRYETPQILVSLVKVNVDVLAYLRKQLIVCVKSRACPIAGIDEREAKAIETLREMISETEYRKYIKYGFILVRGHSGAVYQIFREKSHTKVWEKGKLIEEICVRISDHDIPPTDNVIAFKVLIETSEDLFRKRGNVYNMRKAA